MQAGALVVLAAAALVAVEAKQTVAGVLVGNDAESCGITGPRPGRGLFVGFTPARLLGVQRVRPAGSRSRNRSRSWWSWWGVGLVLVDRVRRYVVDCRCPRRSGG